MPEPAIATWVCADCGGVEQVGRDPGEAPTVCSRCGGTVLVACPAGAMHDLVAWTVIRRPAVPHQGDGPAVVAVARTPQGGLVAGQLVVAADALDGLRVGQALTTGPGTAQPLQFLLADAGAPA